MPPECQSIRPHFFRPQLFRPQNFGWSGAGMVKKKLPYRPQLFRPTKKGDRWLWGDHTSWREDSKRRYKKLTDGANLICFGRPIPPEETTIKNLSSAGNLSWRLPYPQIKRLHFSFVLSVTLWRSKKWMKDVLYALQFLLVGHKKCLVLCVRDWCIVFVFLVIKGTK